jgi:SsrA-binding protein
MTTYVEHKKARFDFEILEEFEAGIELLGIEVKSVKNHQAKLEGSHVIVRGGEAYLIGASISPYQIKNTHSTYDSVRTRKLLLTKKEIRELSKSESTRGLTLIPIVMYNKGSKIKIKIAIARGKKKFDKRETIKKRDIDREIGRTLKD